MSNEESGFGATRAPRQGIGGSPVGSWLTIALAVVAVIAGFLILQNINDSGSSSGNGGISPSNTDDVGLGGSTLPKVTIDVPETSSTTSTVPRVVDGASVVVANANSVGGSAGSMTKVLQTAGYQVEDPVNASGSTVEDSVVYFDAAVEGAKAVAESVGRDLGGLDVLEVESPAPTVSGDLGDAGVLVLLGDSQAGKTIDELSGAADEAGDPPPDPSSSTPSSTTEA